MDLCSSSIVMKAVVLLLVVCTIIGLASCTSCNVYNVSTNWYADTCRWTYDLTSANSWTWQAPQLCPPGYNAAASSNLSLPINFTLQQCADACGAQTAVMGLPAKSVLWWEHTASPPFACQCYLWHLDNANMKPSSYTGLTMADISCSSSTPAPTAPVAQEVIQTSFYDSQCRQGQSFNIVPINSCATVWPENADYIVFKNCSASGIDTEMYFNDNPTCNGTGSKGWLPVGQCYKDAATKKYLVNSCEHSEESRRLMKKKD